MAFGVFLVSAARFDLLSSAQITCANLAGMQATCQTGARNPQMTNAYSTRVYLLDDEANRAGLKRSSLDKHVHVRTFLSRHAETDHVCPD